MRILDILSPTSVKVPLAATEKHAIIDELVDLLATNGLCPDPVSVKRAVWERESQRSTGIGEGLAIPHGKCGGTQGLAGLVEEGLAAGGAPTAPDLSAGGDGRGGRHGRSITAVVAPAARVVGPPRGVG